MEKKVRFSILLVLAFALIVSSCNYEKENPVSNNGEGRIFFKLNRQEVPNSVALVKLTLTRTGYQTIHAELDLMNDTTAEVTVSGLLEGVWHIKVDAYNLNNTILFTGEADVSVISDQITEINITLTQVSSGIGGVRIIVHWPVLPDRNFPFQEYTLNPVLVPAQYQYGVYAENPVVIHDGSKYRMYYAMVGVAADSKIHYAESINGYTWTSPIATPLIIPDPNPAAWDHGGVLPGAAIIKDGTWYLYYQGYNTPFGQWHTGLATSTDGITWTKRPQPVLSAGLGWERQIVPTSIIEKNGLYCLYYTGVNSGTYQIGVATSTDLINWTKHPQNPVMTPGLTWEGTKTSMATVVDEGDSLAMVYAATSDNIHYFGMATSVDGVNWNKYEKPVFSNKATEWAKKWIDYPKMIRTGNTLRVYFSGNENKPGSVVAVAIWHRE